MVQTIATSIFLAMVGFSVTLLLMGRYTNGMIKASDDMVEAFTKSSAMVNNMHMLLSRSRKNTSFAAECADPNIIKAYARRHLLFLDGRGALTHRQRYWLGVQGTEKWEVYRRYGSPYHYIWGMHFRKRRKYGHLLVDDTFSRHGH